MIACKYGRMRKGEDRIGLDFYVWLDGRGVMTKSIIQPMPRAMACAFGRVISIVRWTFTPGYGWRLGETCLEGPVRG